MLTRALQKTAKLLGYRLIKNIPEKKILEKDRPPSPYHTAILTLLARKDCINIVVVGANDGKINDPIYELLRNKLPRQSEISGLRRQPACRSTDMFVRERLPRPGPGLGC